MSPVHVPAAVLQRAHTTAQAAAELADVHLDAAELLGGRAALLGLSAGGRVSAGGATRLMASGDDWCALTLSRPDDIDAVPALIDSDSEPREPWGAIEDRLRTVGVEAFAERARLLGLPIGVLGETAPARPVIGDLGARAEPGRWAGVLVVDMSSMWAGPLCGQVLVRAGATVVKVESARRPDGTRRGATAFFDWMNAGKLSYEADFADATGLRRLLGAADVVIESSRPAALTRRGLGPADIPGRAGRIWLRITGHGTGGDRGDWVAFGDDAAVSGGLVCGAAGRRRFCGDAIADPLTGIHAAYELLASRARGGGELIEMSMAAVSAGYAQLALDNEIVCTATPLVTDRARSPGADNDAVDLVVTRRLAAPC